MIQSPGIRVHCECRSDSLHAQQVYAGLSTLHRNRQIQLTYSIAKKPTHHHTTLTINGSLRAVYDVQDSPRINQEVLDAADYYFKRSYWPDVARSLGKSGDKVYPLGLNYHVVANSTNFFAVYRALKFGTISDRAKKLLQVLPLHPGFTPKEKLINQEPQENASPKILFMVRAWDPYDDPDRAAHRIEWRKHINDTRANCIDALRREFGERFTGGFAHTAFAREHYKHLLIEQPERSSKRNYLDILRNHPICVATSGLHASVGWKFAEYIAFSKAIVTEPLKASHPGDLRAGIHFLEFESVDQCLSAVGTLMEDTALRLRMMQSNYRYYLENMKPEVLVGRTLNTCLNGAHSRSQGHGSATDN
jgi:hypothetical protein